MTTYKEPPSSFSFLCLATFVLMDKDIKRYPVRVKRGKKWKFCIPTGEGENMRKTGQGGKNNSFSLVVDKESAIEKKIIHQMSNSFFKFFL